MDQRLHLPVPAHAALAPRQAAVRRRRRAPGLAVRRSRRELRHPGRRQPGLEAQARDRRAGARGAARQLRPGARCSGRRELAELHPIDRLHHAQERGVERLPQRGAVACRHAWLCPAARQLGPLVGASPSGGLAAEHARQRHFRRPAAARRTCRRRAGTARRTGQLAAEPYRWQLLAAAVRRKRRGPGCSRSRRARGAGRRADTGTHAAGGQAAGPRASRLHPRGRPPRLGSTALRRAARHRLPVAPRSTCGWALALAD